ncbi:U3 small nucleolar RNA-associated protein 20 [Zancudomyces culisetae]|uniref:U3 small nucleolar RNA-associated protein 20 n=1 Tax=Zancudomyces culisetae TaxID=1213189 RepID=A0A1R1PH86_ZANCU|nr:U3 small nucleolar RNA-associated protein 20 [Zancudomyces culisetae]|eukprot:OMH80289.1 U3 small nucleolar RNA-associated protein 20 [Zancudomyces culisetae]
MVERELEKEEKEKDAEVLGVGIGAVADSGEMAGVEVPYEWYEKMVGMWESKVESDEKELDDERKNKRERVSIEFLSGMAKMIQRINQQAKKHNTVEKSKKKAKKEELLSEKKNSKSKSKSITIGDAEQQKVIVKLVLEELLVTRESEKTRVLVWIIKEMMEGEYQNGGLVQGQFEQFGEAKKLIEETEEMLEMRDKVETSKEKTNLMTRMAVRAKSLVVGTKDSRNKEANGGEKVNEMVKQVVASAICVMINSDLMYIRKEVSGIVKILLATDQSGFAQVRESVYKQMYNILKGYYDGIKESTLQKEQEIQLGLDMDIDIDMDMNEDEDEDVNMNVDMDQVVVEQKEEEEKGEKEEQEQQVENIQLKVKKIKKYLEGHEYNDGYENKFQQAYKNASNWRESMGETQKEERDKQENVIIDSVIDLLRENIPMVKGHMGEIEQEFLPIERNNRRIAMYIEMFRLAKIKKVEIRRLAMDKLSNGDREVQEKSFEYLTEYYDLGSSQTESMKRILDIKTMKEELQKYQPKEIAVDSEEDEKEYGGKIVVEIVCRILFGRLVSREGNRTNKSDTKIKRSAIVGFILRMEEFAGVYVGKMIELMVEGNKKQDESKLKNIYIMVEKLGNKMDDSTIEMITEFMVEIIERDVQMYGKEKEKENSKMIHRIFTELILQNRLTDQYKDCVVQKVIMPKMSRFELENTQNESSLLELIKSIIENIDIPILESNNTDNDDDDNKKKSRYWLIGDTTVVNKLIALIGGVKVNAAVVQIVVNITELMLHNLDSNNINALLANINIYITAIQAKNLSTNAMAQRLIRLMTMVVRYSIETNLAVIDLDAINTGLELVIRVTHAEKMSSEAIELVFCIYNYYVNVAGFVAADLYLRDQVNRLAEDMFSLLQNKQDRMTLVKIYALLNPDHKVTIDLLTKLNAVIIKGKRVMLDYEQRAAGFEDVMSVADGITETLVPVFYTLVYMLAYERVDDESNMIGGGAGGGGGKLDIKVDLGDNSMFKTNAGHLIVTKFIETNRLDVEFVAKYFLSKIVFSSGISNKSSVVRNEFVKIVKSLVLNEQYRQIEQIKRIYEYFGSSDTDVEYYFENIIHIQHYRKIRALSKFNSLLSPNNNVDSVLQTVFIPLHQALLFTSNNVDLTNELIKNLDLISTTLTFSAYLRLVTSLLFQLALPNNVNNGTFLRLVYKVLDNYTPNSNREIQNETSKEKERAIVNSHHVILRKINQLIFSKNGIQVTEPNKIPFCYYYVVIQTSVTFSVNGKDSDLELGKFLMQYSSLFKTYIREKSVIKQLRQPLYKISAFLGPKYLWFLISNLQTNLDSAKRSQQKHEFIYLVSKLLFYLKPNTGDLDYCFDHLTPILTTNVFHYPKLLSTFEYLPLHCDLRLVFNNLLPVLHEFLLSSRRNTTITIEKVLTHLTVGITSKLANTNTNTITNVDVDVDMNTDNNNNNNDNVVDNVVDINSTVGGFVYSLIFKNYNNDQLHLLAEFGLNILMSHDFMDNVTTEKGIQRLEIVGNCLFSKFDNVINQSLKLLSTSFFNKCIKQDTTNKYITVIVKRCIQLLKTFKNSATNQTNFSILRLLTNILLTSSMLNVASLDFLLDFIIMNNSTISTTNVNVEFLSINLNLFNAILAIIASSSQQQQQQQQSKYKPLLAKANLIINDFVKPNCIANHNASFRAKCQSIYISYLTLFFYHSNLLSHADFIAHHLSFLCQNLIDYSLSAGRLSSLSLLDQLIKLLPSSILANNDICSVLFVSLNVSLTDSAAIPTNTLSYFYNNVLLKKQDQNSAFAHCFELLKLWSSSNFTAPSNHNIQNDLKFLLVALKSFNVLLSPNLFSIFVNNIPNNQEYLEYILNLLTDILSVSIFILYEHTLNNSNANNDNNNNIDFDFDLDNTTNTNNTATATATANPLLHPFISLEFWSVYSLTALKIIHSIISLSPNTNSSRLDQLIVLHLDFPNIHIKTIVANILLLQYNSRSPINSSPLKPLSTSTSTSNSTSTSLFNSLFTSQQFLSYLSTLSSQNPKHFAIYQPISSSPLYYYNLNTLNFISIKSINALKHYASLSSPFAESNDNINIITPLYTLLSSLLSLYHSTDSPSFLSYINKLIKLSLSELYKTPVSISFRYYSFQLLSPFVNPATPDLNNTLITPIYKSFLSLDHHISQKTPQHLGLISKKKYSSSNNNNNTNYHNNTNTNTNTSANANTDGDVNSADADLDASYKFLVELLDSFKSTLTPPVYNSIIHSTSLQIKLKSSSRKSKIAAFKLENPTAFAKHKQHKLLLKKSKAKKRSNPDYSPDLDLSSSFSKKPKSH